MTPPSPAPSDGDLRKLLEEHLAASRRIEQLLEEQLAVTRLTEQRLERLVTEQAATSQEIAALRLAPALVRLVVILLLVGLLALGIVGATTVSLEGFGLRGGVSPTVIPGRP